ncbi:hypothetical protein HDK90DRAFT_481580 [Phyllosticta capitalensis]|uniref:RNase H type-1 domain-containing protein n=1 Tax=Phyllosticta capitalensis TaxID=121624 RepID=A0ABR1YS36_9PEZI
MVHASTMGQAMPGPASASLLERTLTINGHTRSLVLERGRVRRPNCWQSPKESPKPHKRSLRSPKNTAAFVIATDSNNAVQGVINNLPEWKANGFLNTKGYPICDEAEFRQLDATITKYENLGWSIGLWYVPREYNREADELAGNGARADEGPPRQTFVNAYQVVEYYAEN